jgi:hypothetical protein
VRAGVIRMHRAMVGRQYSSVNDRYQSGNAASTRAEAYGVMPALRLRATFSLENAATVSSCAWPLAMKVSWVSVETELAIPNNAAPTSQAGSQ